MGRSMVGKDIAIAVFSPCHPTHTMAANLAGHLRVYDRHVRWVRDLGVHILLFDQRLGCPGSVSQ